MSEQVTQISTASIFDRNFPIYGTIEEPYFRAKDVAEWIDYDTSSLNKMLAGVDDGEKVRKNLPTPSGVQEVWFVSEDGLYEMLFLSRKPKAKMFKKGVKEALKQIRRTGGYIQAKPEDTPEEIMAKAVLLANKTIELQKQKMQMLEGKNALLEQENQELAPKAQYTDDVLQSNGTYTHSEMAKELNFRSWVAFIDACKKDGILFKHQGGMYMLYAKYSGKGYMKTRTNTFSHKDGSIGTSVISVWTEAGRHFLHEHFNVALQPIDLTMFNVEQDL